MSGCFRGRSAGIATTSYSSPSFDRFVANLLQSAVREPASSTFGRLVRRFGMEGQI